mgnify:CR=1 FL=1
MKETKFKNTEIGRIPDDWEVRTINSFCSVKTGPFGSMLHAEDYVAKGTPIVTTEHFKNGILPLVGKDIPQVGIEDLKRMSSYTLTKDDIVFSRVGSVDINALVTVRQKGWLFSGRVLRVRPFKQTDSLYLHYGLLKHSVRSDIVSRAVGLTMASINTKILGETELSLPPLNEQHSIASALTSIDNLISSLGKLIEKKKNIKQGAMQQLLTGKIRLKEFTEPWVYRKISEIATTSSGGTPSRSIPNYYYGDIKWFTTTELKDNYLYDSVEHITREALNNSSAKMFSANTILMAMYGATIGKLGVLKEPSTTNQACCAIKCNDIVEIFLFYILLYNRKSIIENGCGAGQPNISQVIVNELSFLVPPCEKEQQAIANILSKMDNEITALEAKRAKYEAIKQGMMQQLLTGKIRLIS